MRVRIWLQAGNSDNTKLRFIVKYIQNYKIKFFEEK